ncbi:MAG: family 10 glycosylhydrolase [Dehalococcoidia bacterium]|nr:family 10 glycosylhydrolase [Dehalococcoidia bacterium]
MSTHLSPEHVAAIERDRRVVVNFDAFPSMMNLPSINVEHMKAVLFEFFDDPRTRIDSVWWNFTEGNEAYWPSKILPFIDAPPYGEWKETGFDPVQTLLDETRRRGLETFFTYRINGSDNDVSGRTPRLAMKEEHPDWLIHTWNKTIGDDIGQRLNGYWNFAVQGVRDYKLSILEEVAGQYDYDGMEIDFARVSPVLPPGRQWENRDALTDFMRSVRSMLLRVGEKRGRPYLLAARVPENLVGCRMDGLDVETWAREELVDIFTLGCRSFDVDVAAFRRITEDTHIKLHPVLDDHHSTDGYRFPPIEVFRGVMANWLHQGADGLQTFNFAYARSETLEKYGMRDTWTGWPTHLQFYRELADTDAMNQMSKVYVVQRRGGGHGPFVVPNPEDWSTPRWMYFNTNMLAPLPAELDPDGWADTLLHVYVGEQVPPDAEVTVRLLLSDDSAADLPEAERLQRVLVATIGHPDSRLENVPPAIGIERRVELRLNNALLETSSVDDGWLVFKARPAQLATGENLVGLKLSETRHGAQGRVTIEKLEIHVNR